jgi:autophagy-related protein 5
VSVPRFSYLALLLPRLAAYYGAPCSSFHHEEILLRNLAVGLLLDLYQPDALPWRLVVADGPEWDIADTFTNSAKEADFVRNGNANRIMSLSKENSTALWNAVKDSKWPATLLPWPRSYPTLALSKLGENARLTWHVPGKKDDYASFSRVNSLLLNTPSPLRNVPIRIYIPSSPSDMTDTTPGSLKVVQTLIPPRLPNRKSPHLFLSSLISTLLPHLHSADRLSQGALQSG